MPIYMDFHDLPDGVTAAHVAEMHQADLKIEHKFNCRGLTYWCDERRQTAFCLIEAPDEQAIIDLHKKAHGGVPQRIIEVNDTVVESFLGRIEDPEKSKSTELNIINDPAFRTLMVINIQRKTLRRTGLETLNAALRGYNKSIINIVSKREGRVVQEKSDKYLMSFDSVTNAIDSATEIQEIHNCVITPDLVFKTGISAGVPVTEKEQIFEDTIKRAEYLSLIANDKILVTQEVKELYESENKNASIGMNMVSLNQQEEAFVIQLMDQTNTNWTNPALSASDLHKNMGLSKSKLYRTMVSIIGKSPNRFLKDFRLNKALQKLHLETLNVSEVAYATGFNSPSYFSKSFYAKYGILPSNYVAQNQ